MAAEQELEQLAFQKLYPEEHYDRYIAAGVRPDARVPTECRAAVVSCGIISTADASASVKLGETHVIAGVKLELEAPADDARDRGRLVVQARTGGRGKKKGRARVHAPADLSATRTGGAECSELGGGAPWACAGRRSSGGEPCDSGAQHHSSGRPAPAGRARGPGVLGGACGCCGAER